MNWSDIGDTISKYAPLAASALSSPVGAALGVGTLIANLFGVNADPQSVSDYIKNNPEKAEERIKLEMANNIELQNIVLSTLQERNRHDEQIEAITYQNVDSARKNSQNINASPVDNNIKMILVYGQFFVLITLIGLFFIFKERIDQSVTLTLGTVMGAIMSSIASMVNFYWGTSFSSQKKDDMIAGKK